MTWWHRKRPTPKTQTEVLHEVKHTIEGNEPFLFFNRSPLHMIANLSAGFVGSHTLFEGWIDQDPFLKVKKGDVLAIQIVRVLPAPRTWWDQLRDWWAR